MGFPSVSFTADRAAILDLYRGQEDGRPIHEGSDTYTQASIQAGISQDLRQVMKWVFDQNWPDSAEIEQLERTAALWEGIYRKDPSGASGTVLLTGEVGLVVDSGLALVDGQGQEFQTSKAVVLDANGEAEAAAEAVSTGISTRLTTGAALTVVSPPAGLAGTASVSADWEGGSDRETHEELLARFLFARRHPDSGGNKYDYVRWALEVPGVHAVSHFERRRGYGTNDTVVLVDSATRLPGAALQAAVQSLIDDRHPAGLRDAKVADVDQVAVDITGALTLESGYTLTEVVSRINATLADLFAGLAPGDGLTLLRIQTLIALTEGVADVTLSAPASNVTATVDETTIELLTLGAVSLPEA